MKHDVFISHSSKDYDHAKEICEQLEDNGIKVWIAPRDLTPGNSYASEIVKGIKDTHVVLLLFTENSFESEPVRKEIERSINKKKTIINYKMEDVELDDEWEYLISSVHWLDATDKNTASSSELLINTINNKLDYSRFFEKANPELETQDSTAFEKMDDDKLLLLLNEKSDRNNTDFFHSNSHKYSPESYVIRTSFQEFYAENNASDFLLILGEAGMGKTNEVCNILTNSREEDDHFCFAFNSQLIDERIDHLMAGLFNFESVKKRNFNLDLVLNRINKLLHGKGMKLSFLFDAINEATSYPIKEERLNSFPTVQLLKDINTKILKNKYSNIRVLCSCRTTPYEHMKNSIRTELQYDVASIPTFFLEQYTSDELTGIFERYREHYNILTSAEEFRSVEFSKIRNNLSSPLLFKLVAQSYEDKALPGTIDKYDFVEIVKKMLSQNLYESNFKAYEILLRLTYLFRKKHIDQLSISKIIFSEDEELLNLKKDIITEDGKISHTCDVLFRNNHLRYNNGAIRFAYEKVQEALYEISFLDEHESKYERHVIPFSVYETIVMEQNLDYDVVSYSYLCNAVVSNYLKTRDNNCINELVFNPERRIQTLTQMVLAKLSNIGYDSMAKSFVKDMLNNDSAYILDSALNTIGQFFEEIESEEEYRALVKNNKSPVSYFIFIFNNNTNDKILNKTEVFLYNVILQNPHLTFLILEELFNSFLEKKRMNLNFLMILGLLSFLVAIDTLIESELPKMERKRIINLHILSFWKQIMHKIFNTNSKLYHPKFIKTSKTLSYIPPRLRKMLLRLGIKVTIMKYFNVQSDYVNNLKEYNNFWMNIPAKSKNGSWSRERFGEIADLYDVNNDLAPEAVQLILEGIKTGDSFSFMMIERMLIVRGLHNWVSIKELVETATSYTQNETMYHSYIKMSQCYVLFHIIDKEFSSDWDGSDSEEQFKLLTKVVHEWTKDSYGRFTSPYIKNVKTSYGVYKQFVLNWYIVAACKKSGDQFSLDHLPLIKDLIDEILESKNKDRNLLFYIIENVSVATTNMGKIFSALAIYDYIVFKVNTMALLDEFNLEKDVSEYKDKKLDEFMVSVFNTMKSFFPEQSAYYEAENLSKYVHQRNPLAMAIQSKSKVISVTEETLGSLLTNRFGNFFVWGLNDEEIRDFFVGVLKEAENKRNEKEWAFVCIQNAFMDLLNHRI